jgi:hypothetical protein
MTVNRARRVWTEQCEAAGSIRERYGLKSAFDYLVAEKLINFAEAARRYPDFARELPGFVAAVRDVFAPQEIRIHLERIEREQAKQTIADRLADFESDHDDVWCETPALAAERASRLATIRQLLVAAQLGTS